MLILGGCIFFFGVKSYLLQFRYSHILRFCHEGIRILGFPGGGGGLEPNNKLVVEPTHLKNML